MPRPGTELSGLARIAPQISIFQQEGECVYVQNSSDFLGGNTIICIQKHLKIQNKRRCLCMHEEKNMLH